ncbi:MAG TPA: hypothetical protein VFV38_17115 [Ktedonobacteraceae bacterium]|nr:hypothetical protein [Ktedonobacteraceae bacterium]
MITLPNPVVFYLARGGQEGTLSVSRIFQGQVLWQVQAHQGAITALAWSPDGLLLASGGDDGRIHLWQAATGARLCSCEQGERVERMRWSAHRLLAATSGNLIRIWPVGPAQAIAA